MNYQPNFIKGKTVKELEADVDEMYKDEYQYGRSIDRPRLWDIKYTLEQLKNNKRACTNLVDFINNLNDDIQHLICISESTHWVFSNNDEIEEGWAECFEVVEIVSETRTSIIVKIKCLF